jgi:Ca2+-binding EF-hand superfamily protein
MQYVLKKIDKNRSGTIDLSEFISVLYDKKNIYSYSSLNEAFNYFDANQNGYIEKE